MAARFAGAALLAVLMSGCTQESADQCTDDSSCGFGETCVDGQCAGSTCSTSTDCGMQSTCVDGNCQAGCASDGDCYPGEECADGTCAKASCRDSTLDCGFKEFCDSAAGDCYEASGYYCRDCRDDVDCGGNGNTCLDFGLYGNFCGVTCDVESDCPSGFTCVGLTDGSGNVVTNQCITYCWLYITDDGAEGPPMLQNAELPEWAKAIDGPPTCETGVTP